MSRPGLMRPPKRPLRVPALTSAVAACAKTVSQRRVIRAFFHDFTFLAPSFRSGRTIRQVLAHAVRFACWPKDRSRHDNKYREIDCSNCTSEGECQLWLVLALALVIMSLCSDSERRTEETTEMKTHIVSPQLSRAWLALGGVCACRARPWPMNRLRFPGRSWTGRGRAGGSSGKTTS